jgi:PPM family protein phosphatase
MTLSLRYAARSDVGLLRDGNEDSAYAGPRLLALADGMGGQAYGEVASSTVIASIAHLDEDVPGSELLDMLSAAVDDANERLRQMIEDDAELDTMGTTLTVLYFAGSRLGVVHIGDSRAYLLRDGELSQITRDHTFVQGLVDEGRITAEQASHHPHRSLIMRALDGSGGRVDLDLSVREAREGDRYLVCSDGLSDVVSFETIQQTLTKANGPDDAADDLIGLALRAGGPDNVTCLVADVVATNGQAGLVTPQVVGAAAERATIRRVAPDTPAGRAAALGESGAVDEEDDLDKGAHGDNGAKRAVSSAPRPGPGRPWLRSALLAGFVLAVIGAVGWVGYSWSQRQYYVGPSEGRVAIFRGLSQPVAGIHLSNVYERPDVALSDLPSYDRTEVEQTIEANNLDHARKIVQDLQSDAADCRATRESATASPSRSSQPAGATSSGGAAPSSAPPGATTAGGSTPQATGSPATPGTTPLAGATASGTPSVVPTGTATGIQTPSPSPTPTGSVPGGCDSPTE